jgi:branched-chain amino acid transport system substrate-binding protein
MKSSFLKAAALLACASVLTACQSADDTIKIGVIAPMSGDLAVYGEQLSYVLDAELALVNDKINDGKKFSLIYEDGKCNGSDAVTAFEKLKNVDGVEFVIGGFCSSETLAIEPLLENSDVMLISVASSNPALDNLNPYLFSFSYNDNLIGKTLADGMKDYQKVALISEQNEYNIGI